MELDLFKVPTVEYVVEEIEDWLGPKLGIKLICKTTHFYD